MAVRERKFYTEVNECTKADLMFLALDFKVSNDYDELNGMTVKKLKESILEKATRHAEEWLDDMTMVDLRMFKTLRDEGRLIAMSHQTSLADGLSMMNWVSSGDDDGLIYEPYADLMQGVAPYIDAAIARKEENGEAIMEQAVRGILNMTGMMDEPDLFGLLCRLLPAYDGRLTDGRINSFMEHSMLLREMAGFPCLPGKRKFTSLLIDQDEWLYEIRKGETPAMPDDLEEILAHGAYPYLQPYRKCEKDFCRMLTDCGKKPETEALDYYGSVYTMLQNPNINFIYAFQEIVDDLKIAGEPDLNRCIEAFTELNNGIPKFFLRGNSSGGSMTNGALRGNPAELMPGQMPGGGMPPFGQTTDFPMFGYKQMPIVLPPKVGRNEPCPCGSGKKYKNCCGRGN